MEVKPEARIRDLRKGGWYWIPRAILCHYARQLKASGVLVYNALALFAHSQTQTCFLSQKSLAEICGLSRRTVIRKIRLLEKSGLIRVERRRGRSIYHLLEPAVTGVSYPCDSEGTSDLTAGNTNNSYSRKIQKQYQLRQEFP